jgi:signal transduction histidine kinase
MSSIPNIVSRHISRAAYGFDTQGQIVSDVMPDAIRAVYQAMLQTLEDRLRAQGSSPQAITEAQQATSQAWFSLLGETTGDGATFSEAWIKGTMHLYSLEFFFLAGDYAHQLAGDESLFMRHLVKALLPQQVYEIGKAFSLQQIYRNHESLFYKIMALDLRLIQSGRSRATLQWHSTSALTRIAPAYRIEFAKFMRLLILTMLKQAPVLLKGAEPANVIQKQIDDATNEWTIIWQESFEMPWYALLGSGGTLALAGVAAQTGFDPLAYLTFLPAAVGIGWEVFRQQYYQIHRQEAVMAEQIRHAQLQNLELNTVYANVRNINVAREKQVSDLSAVREAVLGLSSSFDQRQIQEGVVEVMTSLLRFDRAMVLLVDRENHAMIFGMISHPPNEPDDLLRLSNLRIDLDENDPLNQNDPLLGPWLRGQSLLVQEPSFHFRSRLNWALALLEFNHFYSVPLRLGDVTMGVMIVDNLFTRAPISEESRSLLDALATNIAIAMENARLYHLQDEQLQKNLEELKITEQVDRELVDTLELNNVLELLLDWALRFTNARVASVTLFDEALEYGYVGAYYGCSEAELPGGKAGVPIPISEAGITGRAAREAKTQVVADVSLDPDYRTILPSIQANVAVPIMRQRRVVGVMTIESNRREGFSRDHVVFIQRLANRAGVALENARLYTETQIERNKLSSIINQTDDAVIVVDEKGNLVLLNPAALRVFHLPGRPEDYTGKPFHATFEHSTITDFYAEVMQGRHKPQSEIQVEDNTYHANAVLVKDVGYTIILHDVTPFKELDRLKNELVSSVSHDLKNPLAVMKGYVDLVEMTQELTDKGHLYLEHITNSIDGMRQLIDNILDLAKIDSGLELQYEPVDLVKLIMEIEDENSLRAKEKGVSFVNHLDNLDPVPADLLRIKQILSNLISNAVKYTLGASDVVVSLTREDGFARVTIQDHGIGIHPDDLPTIWDRFVRVRNEKTKNIDGTGLGLSIVRSLVEAHGGTVGVTSRENEGSTFWFTLPLERPASSKNR